MWWDTAAVWLAVEINTSEEFSSIYFMLLPKILFIFSFIYDGQSKIHCPVSDYSKLDSNILSADFEKQKKWSPVCHRFLFGII